MGAKMPQAAPEGPKPPASEAPPSPNTGLSVEATDFYVPSGLEGCAWNKLMRELRGVGGQRDDLDYQIVHVEPMVARYLYGLLAKPKGQ